MKKLISIALAATLCMALAINAAAITTGKWDLSGIHEAIQRVADDAPVQDTEPVQLPADLLAQIRAAVKAQREAALKFWNNR